jgi:hypothetical protein
MGETLPVGHRPFRIDDPAVWAPQFPRASDLQPRIQGVVVAGAGFAGLGTVRALASEPVRVTLVDRRHHHLFQPLLCQAETAALNPGDVPAPIRHVLRCQRNAEVILGELAPADATRRTLSLLDGKVPSYDLLGVAIGATHSHFGQEGRRPLVPVLETVEDALETRRRILTAYERAERERDPSPRLGWMTFVLVRAGPTGLEVRTGAGVSDLDAEGVTAGGESRRAPHHGDGREMATAGPCETEPGCASGRSGPGGGRARPHGRSQGIRPAPVGGRVSAVPVSPARGRAVVAEELDDLSPAIDGDPFGNEGLLDHLQEAVPFDALRGTAALKRRGGEVRRPTQLDDAASEAVGVPPILTTAS